MSADVGTQAFKAGCGGCAGIMVALTVIPAALLILLALIGGH